MEQVSPSARIRFSVIFVATVVRLLTKVIVAAPRVPHRLNGRSTHPTVQSSSPSGIAAEPSAWRRCVVSVCPNQRYGVGGGISPFMIPEIVALRIRTEVPQWRSWEIDW